MHGEGGEFCSEKDSVTREVIDERALGKNRRTVTNGAFINYVTHDKGWVREIREKSERDAVRGRARWSVARGQSTLKVIKTHRDAVKSEKR